MNKLKIENVSYEEILPLVVAAKDTALADYAFPCFKFAKTLRKSPVIIAEYREKITDKIHDLLEDTQIDEARIAQEVTIFADKVCVDEELVRLDSHIKAMRDDLNKGGTIGRRLDFIAQEMNREANTTLSKTTDAEISDRAIILKTDIEKVREQIQNIE